MTDPAIREPISFRSEFKFFLRDIPVEITLRLYNPVHSDTVIVRQSHFIAVAGVDQEEQAACEGRRCLATGDQRICLRLQCGDRQWAKAGGQLVAAQSCVQLI